METRKLTEGIHAGLKQRRFIKQMGSCVVCHLASVHFCFLSLHVAMPALWLLVQAAKGDGDLSPGVEATSGPRARRAAGETAEEETEGSRLGEAARKKIQEEQGRAKEYLQDGGR